jgi:hypothetical protein
MHLRDSAVDAPPRSHFAPVENEFLFDWRYGHTVVSVQTETTVIKDVCQYYLELDVDGSLQIQLRFTDDLHAVTS